MTYASSIKRIERLITDIEHSDDIDQALKMHDEAQELLRFCDERIVKAQGKLVELGAMKDASRAPAGEDPAQF